MDSRKDRRLYFLKNKAVLKEKLEQSAFRKGISPAIQGIMKLAPSDHVPITVNFDGTSLASWNLLSDEHTSNFFLDVGRKKHFIEHPLRTDGKKISWGSVLEKLGLFILENSFKDKENIYQIQITSELLNKFVEAQRQRAQKLQNHLNSISGENNIKQALSKIEKAINNIKDAEELVALLTDTKHTQHDDFKNSLIHIIELSYSIHYGFVRWENRLNKIRENKRLLTNLVSHEILCFQECTNPKDMLNLLQYWSEENQLDKKFSMISYAVENNSKDNCVIIYDQNKYLLEDYEYFGLSFNSATQQYTKPCILAKFHSLNNQNSFIVGSIHHPGGRVSELSSILEKVKILDTNIPVIVLGDFNHEDIFFRNDLKDSKFSMVMPRSGTMAGFEYGNNNKAIDGALTNSLQPVKVDLLQQYPFAEQVTLPIKIEISLDQNLECTTRLF